MVIYVKKSRILALMLILIFCVQSFAFAAPRIPVYKVGSVLFFLDKSSGTITGFAGDPGDLTVPTTLGGYKVVSIGAGAFSGASTLKTLCIPDGISTVSANAFANCPNLTSVEISSTVSYIGSRAFAGCTSLSNVILKGTPATIEPDAFQESGWINSDSSEFVILGDTLFKYNGTAENVVVPDGIRSIASGAFAYNTSIKSVTLPEGLQEVGTNAFVHCYFLSDIKIPLSLSHIGAGAFDDTEWMNTRNDEFNVVNGILIAYNGSSRNPELPDGITAIGAGAFMANDKLLSVHLPKTVVYIDSMAFGGCKSLLQINIPKTVEWIDEYAFAGCEKLTIYGRYGAYSHSYAEYMEMPFSTEVYVKCNDEKVYFDTAVPIIRDDRTYLPLRSLMELMGFTVEWDAETGNVTCTKDDRIAIITPAGEITVDGVLSPDLAPPINIKGSNLVPARVIAEAVDAFVNWNNDTRTVEIYY